MPKSRKYFWLFLIPAFALLTITANAVMSAGSSPVALIMKVVQDVEFKKSNSVDWAKAKSGEMLITGDEVRTGGKSLALIKFLDNSLLRVRENSVVKIYADKQQDKRVSKTTHIEKGKVGFEISKQKNDEFRFTTPTMVASIRGTRGMFRVMDDGSSLLVVDEGAIDVASTLGDRRTGRVEGGRFALVGPDGTLETGNATEDQQKESDNSRRTRTKKLIIKTSRGNMVIEYLGNEN